MSRIRCFENGDPKNFYYLPDKITLEYDDNGKYMGYPLTKSGIIEDGCAITTDIFDCIDDVCEPYDSMLNGNITKENISSFIDFRPYEYELNRDWDKYKAVIDLGGYTKDGFNIQRMKEMGYVYRSSKSTDVVNPSGDDNCNEDIKSENNDGLDLRAIIEESVKTVYTKYAELGGNPDNLDPVIFKKALDFVIDGNFDVTTKNLAKEAIDYIKSRRK